MGQLAWMEEICLDPLEGRLWKDRPEGRLWKDRLEDRLWKDRLEDRLWKDRLEDRLGMDPLVVLLTALLAHLPLRLRRLHHNVGIHCRSL